MPKYYPVTKTRRIVTGGGAGGGWSDDYGIEIIGEETNPTPDDVGTFDIETTEADTLAAQTETVTVGIEQGLMDELLATPTETRESSIRRYVTTTRNGGTNPNNATGVEDGSTAEVKAGGLLAGFETMDAVIVPPLDGAGAVPVAKAYYSVAAGLLDSAAAGIYYYKPTTNGGALPVTFIGAAWNDGGTNDATPVTIHADTIADDFLLATVRSTATGSTPTHVTPSGWTQLHTGTAGNNRTSIFYRVAQAGDGGTAVEFWGTGLNQKGVAGLAANEAAITTLRGVDPSTPVESSAFTDFTLSADGAQTLPSVTAAGAGRTVLRLAAVGGANPAGGDPTNGAFDTGTQPRVSHAAAGGSQNIAASLHGSELLASAGPAPARTVTFAETGTATQGSASVLGSVVLKAGVADGSPALALVDLPATGNYLTTPATAVLAGVDTTQEVFFRFSHTALLPLVGGSVSIDTGSLDSEGVL